MKNIFILSSLLIISFVGCKGWFKNNKTEIKAFYPYNRYDYDYYCINNHRNCNENSQKGLTLIISVDINRDSLSMHKLVFSYIDTSELVKLLIKRHTHVELQFWLKGNGLDEDFSERKTGELISDYINQLVAEVGYNSGKLEQYTLYKNINTTYHSFFQ